MCLCLMDGFLLYIFRINFELTLVGKPSPTQNLPDEKSLSRFDPVVGNYESLVIIFLLR